MNSNELFELRKKRSEALKNTRRALGITKLALCEKTGLTRQTIDRIERNAGSWGIDTELLYVNGLHIDQPKQS